MGRRRLCGRTDPVTLLPMGWRMGRQELRKTNLDGPYKPGDSKAPPELVPWESMLDANLITSAVQGSSGQTHKVLLDIDVPAELVQSSTPGHSHLYIDVDVPVVKYLELLKVLAECGVIEPGYYGASKARGYTALRPPWVKKGKR